VVLVATNEFFARQFLSFFLFFLSGTLVALSLSLAWSFGGGAIK